MDIEGCVGPQNSLLWPFWALFSFLWHTMTLPYTKNYSNILPGLCLNYSNLDWHWSTRLEPPNPLMVQRAIFSSFGPYGALRRPRWPTWPTKLFLCITTDVQGLVPPLFHTVPPDWSHQTNIWPKKNVFGLFGPFVCPLMPLDGPLWPTKLLRSTTPDVPWLVPPLFQTVSSDCSHKTRLWPKKVIFGTFV